MFVLNTSIKHCNGTSVQYKQARKRKKSIQIRKKEVKLSLFADHLVICVENINGDIYFVNSWEDLMLLWCEFSQNGSVNPMQFQ